MAYDIGDVVTLTLTVRDPATGDLANAGSAALVVTLPDATTASVTPTNPSTGSYVGAYTTTVAGRHPYQWTTSGANAGVLVDVFDVYDSTTVPIVSLSDLKRELNITSTTNDAELADYLRRATSILEQHTGRAFARQTRTETFDVIDGERTVLLAPPVISVTTVTNDTGTIASDGYNLNKRSGILTLDASGFAGGVAEVSVTYVCGYTQPPPGLVQAVLQQVRHMWETQRTTPGARRDDEWNPAQGYMIPNRVAEALRPYMVLGSGA